MARPKKQADDKWRAWFNVNQDSYVGDENGVAICVCVNKTAERKVIAALNNMEYSAAKLKLADAILAADADGNEDGDIFISVIDNALQTYAKEAEVCE